jgi:hypothetical protein
LASLPAFGISQCVPEIVNLSATARSKIFRRVSIAICGSWSMASCHSRARLQDLPE